MLEVLMNLQFDKTVRKLLQPLSHICYCTACLAFYLGRIEDHCPSMYVCQLGIFEQTQETALCRCRPYVYLAQCCLFCLGISEIESGTLFVLGRNPNQQLGRHS